MSEHEDARQADWEARAEKARADYAKHMATLPREEHPPDANPPARRHREAVEADPEGYAPGTPVAGELAERLFDAEREFVEQVEAGRRTERGDIRAGLAQMLDDNQEEILGLFMETIRATKKRWAYCPTCRGKVQVDFVNEKALAECMKMYIELSHGRTKEVPVPPQAPTILALEQLEGLSDAELAQIAAS